MVKTVRVNSTQALREFVFGPLLIHVLNLPTTVIHKSAFDNPLKSYTSSPMQHVLSQAASGSLRQESTGTRTCPDVDLQQPEANLVEDAPQQSLKNHKSAQSCRRKACRLANPCAHNTAGWKHGVPGIRAWQAIDVATLCCIYVHIFIYISTITSVCIYMYMYQYHVCMYVCMNVCMHVCIDMYQVKYRCIDVRVVCMHVCMHVCMYGFMDQCIYVCMHACMHACTHACMQTCTDMFSCKYGCIDVRIVGMYVCMYVRMYVCMYVCMHASNVCMRVMYCNVMQCNVM